MFTGLITECGTITDITRTESAAILTVRAPHSVADLAVGDSIAVNGVCRSEEHTSELQSH